MRADKFTTSLQNALADAQSLAVNRNHSTIEPGHLLLAMLGQQGGTIRPLLEKSGANINALQSALEDAINALPTLSQATGEVSLSPNLARLLNLADKYAQDAGDSFIASEAVLMAGLQAGSPVEKLLSSAGVDKTRVAQAIETLSGGEEVTSQAAEANREALDKYTIDLTERAESGKLDPVIGRDDEIRRTIQV